MPATRALVVGSYYPGGVDVGRDKRATRDAGLSTTDTPGRGLYNGVAPVT